MTAERDEALTRVEVARREERERCARAVAAHDPAEYALAGQNAGAEAARIIRALTDSEGTP